MVDGITKLVIASTVASLLATVLAIADIVYSTAMSMNIPNGLDSYFYMIHYTHKTHSTQRHSDEANKALN